VWCEFVRNAGYGGVWGRPLHRDARALPHRTNHRLSEHVGPLRVWIVSLGTQVALVRVDVRARRFTPERAAVASILLGAEGSTKRRLGSLCSPRRRLVDRRGRSRRRSRVAAQVVRRPDSHQLARLRLSRLLLQRKGAETQGREERLSQSVHYTADAVFDEPHTEIDDQRQLEVHEPEVGQGLRPEHRIVRARRFTLDHDPVLDQ